MLQYHYLGWPDHGLPSDISPLNHMVELAKDSITTNPENNIMAHCSAGVGRTGTFISLVNLIGSYKASERLSVFRTVRLLREQRILMVERSVLTLFHP